MKQKEKWAEEYSLNVTGKLPIIINVNEVWLAGFEFAKEEVIKSLMKDYQWTREDIENVGEQEL